MKTKKQKQTAIEEGKKLLEGNRNLVFVDFTGASVEDLKSLRKTLKEIGAKLKVVKKKLMRVLFEKEGIDFNPEQFESQLATIFADKDISEIAGPVYKFFEGIKKKGFSAKGGSAAGGKILGAYDLPAKSFLDGETVTKIGKLPSREVLLGQLVGMLASPIRMFLYVLNEKSKMVEK